ncbi:MAG: HAMP domain-containing histidine kinase [Ruminococcus sp.]|nr:HAMP domain-containing histidine kinase [Ruminococcus sp.]
MIKKFRRKFILITLITLVVVEIIIIGTINAINFHQINKETDDLINILVDNNGKFPEPKEIKKDKHQENEFLSNQNGNIPDMPMFEKGFNAETRYVTRYFVVEANSSNVIGKIDTGHIAAIDSDTARVYGQEILESGKKKGYFGNYRYLVKNNNGNKLIVFVDCSMQLDTKYRFLAISCFIAIGAFAIFSIVLLIISKRAVRPYIEAMEKQSRFITDAGHEIKTPLAIISANNEVIEMINGKSEWSDSIKNQVKRLSDLVKQLITLAKMDEEIKPIFSEFNLSDAVYDVSASFVTLAQTKEKTAVMDIDDGLIYSGDEGAIRQLVSVLLDNAVKYTDKGGTINVSLKRVSKAYKIRVFNECRVLPKDDLNMLFDRFYRSDPSRSRETGGYGIGLSIAKSIVDLHKGKINAVNEENGIAFEVLLK